MTALAAGLSMALAGEANAQSTEIMIPLDSGEEIVIHLSGISAEVQGDVMATLQGCIGDRAVSRDECVTSFAKDIAQIRLNAIVRNTHQQLVPLENDIGLTAAEIIQEPVFCDYAASVEAADQCKAGTEEIKLAALDLQIASTRNRRIAAETRDATISAKIENEQVANATRLEQGAAKDNTISTVAAERDAETERADANAAVLVALQRVAATETAKN